MMSFPGWKSLKENNNLPATKHGQEKQTRMNASNNLLACLSVDKKLALCCSRFMHLNVFNVKNPPHNERTVYKSHNKSHHLHQMWNMPCLADLPAYTLAVWGHQENKLWYLIYLPGKKSSLHTKAASLYYWITVLSNNIQYKTRHHTLPSP